MRRRRVTVAATAAALLVAVIAAGLALNRPGASRSSPSCTATVGTAAFTLDVSQAANAGTIAAVGKREQLSDHAVTIALAAALQESKLRNLPGGDQDSVGLFQQRPSQGWGARAQLMNPRYAAASFYLALSKVPGWSTMAVTDAAQQVQRSAAPDAYASWEPQARLLAQVLTGEAPAGFGCRFDLAGGAGAAIRLATAMAAELGRSTLGTETVAAHGWITAGWLVSHARAYRITEVRFAGLRWTPSSAVWAPYSPVRSQVELRRAGVAPGAELST